MKTIETSLTTTAIFSDDRKKRYLLHKEWDTSKPSLAIIMLAPSEAAGIELDSTTLLVLNNVSRLGFGSVSIVNLFSTLNDFSLTDADDEDKENIDIILREAKSCDTVVYAPGVGKAKNQNFQKRSSEVIKALKPYEKKLMCISNKAGTVCLVHPLTPSVREWVLTPIKIADVISKFSESVTKDAKKQAT